jgi:hypothetical protein
MTKTNCHGKIHHAFKNGKPSISMGHLYHGYVSHNQRVILPINLCNLVTVAFCVQRIVGWTQLYSYTLNNSHQQNRRIYIYNVMVF